MNHDIKNQARILSTISNKWRGKVYYLKLRKTKIFSKITGKTRNMSTIRGTRSSTVKVEKIYLAGLGFWDIWQ